MNLSGRLEEAILEEAGTELEARVDALLASFTLDNVQTFVSWFRSEFAGVSSARTPAGKKGLKSNAEWFIKSLDMTLEWGRGHQSGQSQLSGTLEDFVDSRRVAAEQAWRRIKDQASEMSVFSGQDIPREVVVGQNVYVNKIGLGGKTFNGYVSALEKLWQTIRGWRAGALVGGIRVVLAGPKDFRGSAGGTYRSMEDALYVRATPAVLKRSAGTYGALDYILIHELGHRYERKKSIKGNFDFGWSTSRYSNKEGEAFAELFALGHFGVTRDAHGSWDPSIQQKFEALMGN